MLKQKTQYLLQKYLGFNNYLLLFSRYKIMTLPYDKGEKDFLSFVKLIKKEGIILDIGANIGLMTVTLAKKFPKSKIFAFEPIPDNSAVLNKNINGFKLQNTKSFSFALGDREGCIDMVMPEVNSVKMQGLCHVLDESIPKKSQGETFCMPVHRLDDVEDIINRKEPVVGIKMDVEHFEWAVLEGAKELLSKDKPIIYCELGDNENRTKCFKILNDLGYNTYVAIDDKLVEFAPQLKYKTNFIFVPAKEQNR